jgi:glycosyltransferase involved in cell wall biosynthesis
VAFVAGDDPFTTLAALDALVVPSRAEGLGSIALAAQAAGVPVIAAATGGLPEIVRHERTGLLVAPDDPGALAAALDRVRGEPEATRERARQARAAVADYAVARIVERTAAAYAAARANAGRGPR